MSETIVSVIMSAYNCAPYIAEALDSIINQTYESWELIICDDGSDDGTWDVIQKYVERYPEKIITIRNRINRKQAFSRNRCIKKARGSYIAIMDADDLCDLSRLKKQVDFLDAHPEISFVGTGMTIFDENSEWGQSIGKPLVEPVELIAGGGFIAASCMFRKEVLISVKGYRTNPKYYFVEDYELIQRLYETGYRGANLQEPLYKYREYQQTIERRRLINRIHGAMLMIRGIYVFKLSPKLLPHVFRGILVGLLPLNLYRYLHRRKYS